MIPDLEKLPIIDPDPKASDKRTRDMLVAEGRAAYIAGMSHDHVTSNFIDKDMKIDWSNGWRWEKEAHDEERNNCKCEGCRKYGRRRS